MNNENRKINLLPILLICIGVVIIITSLIVSYLANKNTTTTKATQKTSIKKIENEFVKFKSAAEMQQYLAQNTSSGMYALSPTTSFEKQSTQDTIPLYGGIAPMPPGQAATRVSETNVQVLGIDEPDIVKNDNQTIYYARENNYYYGNPMPLNQNTEFGMPKIMPPQKTVQETTIIAAYPPDTMKKLSQIDKSGELLFKDNILVVLTDDGIYAYNVQDKANPNQVWKITLKNNTIIEHARMYEDMIYLVSVSNMNRYKPCPYIPLEIDGKDLTINCTEIYHPKASVSADATYTLVKINLKTGKEEDKISFIGSRDNSTVYMSPNSIYITYGLEPDIVGFFATFIEERASDLVPIEVRDRIKKLQTYEISNATKLIELMNILEAFGSDKTTDEKLKLETEMQNRIKTFAQENKKQLSSSQIVKLNVKNLQKEANAIIPGKLLNQFSMDEFNGNLRVAVTIGGWANLSNTETTNEVYILNSNLETRGIVTDLGKGETIYSARFLGNRGYVVTFKEIDPFYVLDLSNPDAPSMKGELKIPGFSSYLHPLSDTIIVGIGREDANAKVSLFDVSRPENPTEISKYTLKDYTSEILQTHHAFLNDPKYNVMFIPGDTNGYIISYKDNNLKLVKAISNINPRRALYMNDYMYIVGNNEIVVYDEKTWEEVKRIDLSK